MTPSTDYPLLARSHKNQYPFRLATTSFIYPADWVENTRLIGPYIDEIELLFFESRLNGSLPSAEAIRNLADIGGRLKTRFNIHLPTDIVPGSVDPAENRRAIETLLRIRSLTEPLSPTSYTLHVEPEWSPAKETDVTAWQERLQNTLLSLVEGGFPARQLALETLHFPFEWVAPVIQRLGLGVCLDIGHLLVDAQPVIPLLSRYRDRLPIIHLHGVDGEKDHLSIDHLPTAELTAILSRLRRYTGTLSLEVFSFSDLKASLETLAACWHNTHEVPQ
jgi:sugar phosphate isomerase/epimerase